VFTYILLHLPLVSILCLKHIKENTHLQVRIQYHNKWQSKTAPKWQSKITTGEMSCQCKTE